MMKENYEIASNEWFVPKNWRRGSIKDVLEEKKTALNKARNKLKKLQELKGLIAQEHYVDLEEKFQNLYFVAKLWLALTKAFLAYANQDKAGLELVCEELLSIDCEGKKVVKNNYYPMAIVRAQGLDCVPNFVNEIRNSFEKESCAKTRLCQENLTDYIVCGGGNEGHKLQKEVNFSDTYIFDDGVCRIPGTNRGKAWSTVNAHGWFSYEIRVKANEENEIVIVAKGSDGYLEMSVDIEGEKTILRKRTTKKEEMTIKYFAKTSYVRVRIDRISSYTPFIYEIKVK